MTERRRTAAQYLNGLAVAVVATVCSSVATGNASPLMLLLAALTSGTLHGIALIVSA